MRHAVEEYPIRASDCICSPAEPEQPHQFINTSNDELNYSALGSQAATDVMLYPDSGNTASGTAKPTTSAPRTVLI